MQNHEPLLATITPELQGSRLDQAVAALFPEYSRTRLKEWIQKERVWVNGLIKRPRDSVFEGDSIEVHPEAAVLSTWTSEAMPIECVYEDEHILVINKPAALVVHPGAGNLQGTLVNALLHHEPRLNQVPRAGIVHRLDKDTTGLMVVAKTLEAQTALVAAIQARTVQRVYEAVVYGVMVSGGTIDQPMGRHPRDRTRMAVLATGGRRALTHYRIIKRFKGHTHVRVQLETGRTHQIRVHMAYIRHPIVGDAAYGKHLGAASVKRFERQALHAKHLALQHPITGLPLSWEIPLPSDMQALLVTLAAI